MTMKTPKGKPLKDVAKQYVLKGEKYNFGGPIYYNDNVYWVIYYSKGGMFRKPTPTCLLVLDENCNIITSKDIYNKVALTFLYPRPTSEFLKVYTDEVKEISVVQKFFSRPEKYVGRVNISELKNEITDQLKEISAVLEKIIDQSSRIEATSSKLLEITNNSVNVIKKLTKKLRWENMENFVKNVIFNEYKLLTKLLNAFNERSVLLKKLVATLESLSNQEKSIGKIHLLLRDAKTEIVALEKLNVYFEEIIKIREELKAVCEESQEMLEKFFNEMINRTSSS
ncbi:MAG: hypothetical protein ACTSYM_10835 [Candidatus Baldrarchaeia archaeon]